MLLAIMPLDIGRRQQWRKKCQPIRLEPHRLVFINETEPRACARLQNGNGFIAGLRCHG
ncbi:hypothetical protein [Mesorhizobium sp. STM 4661]|uniref:hypothetical protein n=1 Tax=Mesorhizobium sp. STM 4661 TaxID=1297570 RepID=UPI0002BE0612|nr:hypothetical protein [Mesorhizobium sp. STM 4661]CCV12773.1 hypothetical protein MESS4_50020 [Mesorhizobium sp. STM 4661]